MIKNDRYTFIDITLTKVTDLSACKTEVRPRLFSLIKYDNYISD